MASQFTRRHVLGLLSIGLGAGSLTTLMSACGPNAPAQPATSAATAPTVATKPAAGGTLSILMWQGPTIANGHLSQGTKDYVAARFCCEPLLTVSADGVFSPVLAAEVPSMSNGGLAADGKTVTYKLRPNVKWADGQPFDAEDVAFTFQY